ncbi:MAG: histone deacetylase, partial [Myxococcota bacterium]
MLLLARSPRFQDHDPGPYHPERPERLAAIDTAVDGALAAGVAADTLELRPATREELARAHGEPHLERLSALRGQAAQLDADTATSAASVDVAELAAGATIDMMQSVLSGRHHAGLALVRPPGHHAIPERAMGFCLLGNVAIAVKNLLDTGAAERVAIYDWDVHHGNGTQDMFYDDPRVLFMSTHQWPFYPGTGAVEETGAGEAEGSTMNLPLPAGSGDEDLLTLTRDVLAPRVRAFAPDLIVVSAGYDGHVADPLGGFSVTTDGYRELSLRWR